MKKNKKKNNEKKQLMIAIVAVALIIALAGGGTYAYWSWQSGTGQNTPISVNVAGANLLISGGNVANEGMYPTNDCDGAGALVGSTTTVTVKNETESPFTVSLKIRATIGSTSSSYSPISSLSHLKWAIVELASSTATAADNACTSPIASGTFSAVTTKDTATDIDTGITFTASAATSDEDTSDLQTTNKYYKLYVWLDSGYSHTNYGDTISDPMQYLKLNVQWSPASIMTQIAN